MEVKMSEAGILIYIRGREYKISDDKISFAEVVNRAYPDGKQGPDYEYDVRWKDGPKDRPEGILKEGETTPIVNEMKFDVILTDKS